MQQKFKFHFLKLSLICIIAFILQQLIPNFTNLFILNQRAINNLELWRFITSIFLHGDIIHLAYNLFALLLFGFILEKLIGSKKFLILFLISGIIANIISINFYPSSLGASGAIYGILGAIIILKPLMMVWAFGIMMPMFIAGILWIIGDIMGAFGFGKQGVGNIAHLSGIAIGILTGILLTINSKNKQTKNNKIKIPDKYIQEFERVYMN